MRLWIFVAPPNLSMPNPSIDFDGIVANIIEEKGIIDKK
jgi:hypothetical protein